MKPLRKMTPELAITIAIAKARVLLDAARPCPICGYGWREKCGRVCGLRDLAEEMQRAKLRDRNEEITS